MLHPGYSTRRIATELQGAGIIRSKEAFIIWHYFRRRRSLKAGVLPNSALGMTEGTDPSRPLHELVTMASIVEKETSVPAERREVAGVYFNRLNKRIALDADPSIIYAELLAGTYQGALHHADMRFSSPYNTYRNAGLPPGPIGNPGRTSLEAAMHPAQSDYYYFVADAAGHHRFAHTIEEHNKNVAAYRR